MRIRGGSGLGDAIYVRAVAEHLAAEGHDVVACSDYPGAFEGAVGVRAEPFRRERIDRLAHYSARKEKPDTNQWQDICDAAQITRIPLRINWRVGNRELVSKLRTFADGKPLILVHGGRIPMGRTDGFGKELLPRAEAFDAVLESLRDCFLVQIGQAHQLYALDCDISLHGSTSVGDLLDLGLSCDGIVGQCSFVVPLAEVFDKPLLCVWSAAGLRARSPYIRAITPRKILSKPTSRYVMDDWPEARIQSETRLAMGFQERAAA